MEYVLLLTFFSVCTVRCRHVTLPLRNLHAHDVDFTVKSKELATRADSQRGVFTSKTREALCLLSYL